MLEKFILFAADTKDDDTAVASSLDELEALVQTLGASVSGRLVQKLERINGSKYLGTGKLEELKELAIETGANAVVCDDELSPAQYRVMGDILGLKLLDRTTVILDIFAQNAKSAEAIAQVEMAQHNYRLARLTGLGRSLSRLGGGIGTRGPGEKKLETDRRHIRSRISQLKNELADISQRREKTHTKRKRNAVVQVALVGYTNAGKSSVMNLMTNAGVLAEDKLFATLETTTRLLDTAGAGAFLLSDTVGFIQKLPHALVKAFRATLSEIRAADILLHIVDSASPAYEQQMQTVYATLDELHCQNIPVITVFNKTDVASEHTRPHDSRARRVLRLSAVTGEGTDALNAAIAECIRELKTRIDVLIPYAKGAYADMIYKSGEIIKEDFIETGSRISAFVPRELANKLQEYAISL